MIGGIYDSLSGLAAAQTKIVAAAHNTANAHTDGFKKHQAIVQEVRPQEITASIEQVKTPAPVFFEETEVNSVFVEQSNVDLGEEMINLMLGKRMFEANMSALKSQNQTLGSLIDIVQ